MAHRPRRRAGTGRGKVERQTDRQKTQVGNDPFFSFEAGLVAESSSSRDSLRWLPQHAQQLQVQDIVGGEYFQKFIVGLGVPTPDEQKEISQLVAENATRQPWSLFVLLRGLAAQQFITSPTGLTKRPARFALEHFVSVVRDVGFAIAATAADQRRMRALTLDRFLTCVARAGEGPYLSYADVIHIAQWLLLHRVLHKILYLHTAAGEASPMLTPPKPFSTVEELTATFSERARKGRPSSARSTTAAAATADAAPASTNAGGAAAASARDSDVKRTSKDRGVGDDDARKAVFTLYQLMDRLAWLPVRVVDALLQMPDQPSAPPLPSPLPFQYAMDLKEVSAELLRTWDGIVDPVTEHSLGIMSCVADIYRPASGANRSRPAILYLLDKCSASRSKVRMWKSQYGPPVRFDARQRDFVIQSLICSLLGNYEHFSLRSHPSFALRCFLNQIWFRMRRSSDRTWRFMEYLLTLQDALLQDVVRQYIDYVCRYSEVINDHRKMLHASAADAESLEREINAIVDKSREMFDRARLMIFTRDVLIFDRAPAAVGPVLKAMNSITYSRSHATMLKRNYGKSKLGFMTELRARFQRIPPCNSRLVAQLRDVVRSWIGSYGERHFRCTAATGGWPERFYNLMVGTHHGVTSIATIIAQYRRFDFIEDGVMVHEDDTTSELGITRERFDVLQTVVLDHVDPFCPKPEYLLRALLPAFGACPASIELFDTMVFSHGRAQHIDGMCLKMLQLYPDAYSVMQTFAALWERRTSLIVFPLSQEQMEAQLVATAHRPDLRFLLYCRACARIRTTVSECKAQRVTTRAAANVRNINVVREGWTPSLVDLIRRKEETKLGMTQLLRAHPRAVCNESSVFGDCACYQFGSLVKIPIVGCAVEYRGSVVRLCSFPGCGTHAIIDAKRCAFWQGDYICSTCTICLLVIGRRLERYFGIVGGPWTIEMPYLNTIQHNPMEVVLSRILQKERNDELAEEAQLKKYAGVPGLVARLKRGGTLTPEQRKAVMDARKEATVVRQAQALASRTNRLREAGKGRSKPKK